jgi:hypothetical protein
MSTWFSDHFGADGLNDTSLASPRIIPSAGIAHGRVRYKRAYLSGLCIAADVLRFFSMKSGDRLIDLMLSSDGGSTAGAINVGLHLSGDNHDGDAVDADLFASAQAISTAMERTSIFAEATTLQHEDHGKTLWALAAIGAGSDTVDPLVSYDITGTVSTTFTDAVSILVMEAYYTSGD